MLTSPFFGCFPVQTRSRQQNLVCRSPRQRLLSPPFLQAFSGLRLPLNKAKVDRNSRKRVISENFTDSVHLPRAVGNKRLGGHNASFCTRVSVLPFLKYPMLSVPINYQTPPKQRVKYRCL